MKELELFKTYNGITRKYVVMAITVQDLLNDPRYKDNKSLLLLARPNNVIPSKPRKKRKQKTTRQLLLAFIKKQEKFNEMVISQFKARGWIK